MGPGAGEGGHAYQRLLQLAETRDSGQVHRIALFIAATYNGGAFPFDLFELRAVDEAISDDMLLCIDAASTRYALRSHPRGAAVRLKVMAIDSSS